MEYEAEGMAERGIAESQQGVRGWSLWNSRCRRGGKEEGELDVKLQTHLLLLLLPSSFGQRRARTLTCSLFLSYLLIPFSLMLASFLRRPYNSAPTPARHLLPSFSFLSPSPSTDSSSARCRTTSSSSNGSVGSTISLTVEDTTTPTLGEEREELETLLLLVASEGALGVVLEWEAGSLREVRLGPQCCLYMEVLNHYDGRERWNTDRRKEGSS